MKFLGLCGGMLVLPLAVAAQYLIPTPVSQKNGSRRMNITKISTNIDARLNLPAEGYILKVKDGKVTIRSKDAQGIIWAKATLRQLKDENGKICETTIVDYPAFPIRGFMHDTGRNFRSTEQLKKELDLFSAYKLNVFHWHLTDYPAWRIECKAYPQLNDARFQRQGRDEGKFYSYAEIRDIIAYAKERGITIIPEIDMPGHSDFFNQAFGFSMASKEGMKILKTCLEEFFHEIPKSMCPFIHIGSDEIHIDNPEEFMNFCETIVQQNGREIIAWQPGLKGSDKIITQIWRDLEQAKISLKNYPYRYIDSYMGYLNKGNPFLNIYKYLLHTPCNTGSRTDKALGGILCLWNDVRVTDKSLLFPHNGMPQNLLPFSERFWHGGIWTDSNEETTIPNPTTTEWKRLRNFEKKMIFHRDHFLHDWDIRWVANLNQHWQVTLPQRRGTDPDEMKWVEVWGGVVDIMAIAKKYGVKIQPTMDAWMRTSIESPTDTVIQAWIGFETPPRSSRISDGIGYQGEWESQGRVFVNGKEIMPPDAWKEPGKYRYMYQTWKQAPSELPYTNEQFFWMRTPARIPLRAGRNEIQLYCPRVFPNESWIVGFLPVTIDRQGHVSEVRGVTLSKDDNNFPLTTCDTPPGY